MAVQGGSGTRAGRLSQTGRPSEPVKGSEYPFTGALSAVQASSMSGGDSTTTKCGQGREVDIGTINDSGREGEDYAEGLQHV